MNAAMSMTQPLPRPTARLKPRLVVADDCEEMRWIIRTALADSFIDIIEVSNGRELFWTVEALASKRGSGDPPLVVISDIYMPVYSGMDVLEAWQDEEWPVALVAISSFPDPALRRRVNELGGLLVAKPFTTHQLRAAVRAALD